MTTIDPPAESSWRTPLMVIAAGCGIAMIGFGVRSTFGLFLEPMTEARAWNRETFSIALAIQNLLWGIGVPIAGMIADRFGPSRVIILGALLYAAGTWSMSVVESGPAFYLVGGVLVGLGVAFTAFSLALAAMARVVPRGKRSFILGLGTAAGSLGQFVFSPNAQAAIDFFGWQGALLALAASALVIVPLALILPRATTSVDEAVSDQSMMEALREARVHSGYILLTMGFLCAVFRSPSSPCISPPTSRIWASRPVSRLGPSPWSVAATLSAVSWQAWRVSAGANGVDWRSSISCAVSSS
jgi:MFS family permease